MSWITDEDMQALVTWRKKQASVLEEATRRATKADKMTKVTLAFEMKKSPEKTAAAQERDALTSPAYLAAVDEVSNAEAALINERTLDDVAKMKFEIWRTMTSMQKALMK